MLDTVVISNDERYSSGVETFLLLGSATYPVSEWNVLGEFRANNVNGEQTFNVETALWARYIKLRCVREGDIFLVVIT